jgi:hypothetical protein
MNVNEAMPNRCMAKQALGKTWLRDGKGHWQGGSPGVGALSAPSRREPDLA